MKGLRSAESEAGIDQINDTIVRLNAEGKRVIDVTLGMHSNIALLLCEWED